MKKAYSVKLFYPEGSRVITMESNAELNLIGVLTKGMWVSDTSGEYHNMSKVRSFAIVSAEE